MTTVTMPVFNTNTNRSLMHATKTYTPYLLQVNSSSSIYIQDIKIYKSYLYLFQAITTLIRSNGTSNLLPTRE